MLSTVRLSIFRIYGGRAEKSAETERKRSLLKVKLQKALRYCDYTKETGHVISEACETLWDDIEQLNEELNKKKN